VVIVDPSPIILAEYNYKQRQLELERGRLARLLTTPSLTLDGHTVELLANIEMPADAPLALEAGAQGVGLFRSEFLFMGRHGADLPDEEEQYLAYRQAVEGMKGLPVTIRTVDVGADKPMDGAVQDQGHLNPALGLRAIRWSLADPDMFVSQLRAIYRAAVHGPVKMMIPMLAHLSEIRQTLTLVEQARKQLQSEGVPYGQLEIGAMIEIPAAVLIVHTFLRHFDFLSLGTNDLIQYTLAIDRTDESVAHLYDPMHPAVLRLLADTIAAARQSGKPVSVCGEMAGDITMTRLLLGLGLRCFSMHPAQILAVKQEVLRADTRKLEPWALQVLASEEPANFLLQ
jgi:phosphotransferase system enzyme I (PtsI)